MLNLVVMCVIRVSRTEFGKLKRKLAYKPQKRDTVETEESKMGKRGYSELAAELEAEFKFSPKNLI